jgi:hypothetical protein
MKPGVRVKLKVDLTKYLEGAVIGTEGTTIGEYGMWSRSMDSFTGVNFDGLGCLDVLIESFEIIDPIYLKEIEQKRIKFLEDLKSAKNIEVTLGPRGGFKHLHYEYLSDGINHNTGNGFKKDAEELIEHFISLNKEIKYKYD